MQQKIRKGVRECMTYIQPKGVNDHRRIHLTPMRRSCSYGRGTLSILIECSPRNCVGDSLTLVAWSSRQKLCRNTTNIIIWRQSNVLNYLLLLMRTLEVRKNILRHFCIRCLAHHHKTCRLGLEPSNEVYIRQIMRICKIYSRNGPSLQAVFFCAKIQIIETLGQRTFLQYLLLYITKQ